MPPCDSEQFRWFAEHLRPHESILRTWLRGYVAAADDLDDIVQEAYLRVLQARETCRIEAPRAFLFATARNVALMRVRRRRTERIDALAEREVENIQDQCPDVADAVARSQELNLLTEAIQSLPARCRQVLTLRKLYGLSQKETAAQLGIAEHTVEAQSTIALRKLADFFERIDGGPGKSHG